MQPSPERFRALARSSPWRFETLRFRFVRRTAVRDPFPQVRAWLRRPGLLRVERLDGDLVRVVRARRGSVGLLTFQGGTGGPAGRIRGLHPRRRRGGEVENAWPHEAAPATDAEGIVRQRPSAAPADRPDLDGVGYDDPIFQSYDWVAVLDPWELADPTEYGGDDDPPATRIDELRAVTHHDRPAWEAVLRPTVHYDPRCSCCPLLRSPESDAREAEAGGLTPRDLDCDFEYPDAHRVRLDVATGVCVWTEHLGGTRDGDGLDVVIEAVDEPMRDDLFQQRRVLPRRR